MVTRPGTELWARGSTTYKLVLGRWSKSELGAGANDKRPDVHATLPVRRDPPPVLLHGSNHRLVEKVGRDVRHAHPVAARLHPRSVGVIRVEDVDVTSGGLVRLESLKRLLSVVQCWTQRGNRQGPAFDRFA